MAVKGVIGCRHEQKNPVVRDIYPNGIHRTIAEFLQEEGFAARTPTLDEPEHGLTDQPEIGANRGTGFRNVVGVSFIVFQIERANKL